MLVLEIHLRWILRHFVWKIDSRLTRYEGHHLLLVFNAKWEVNRGSDAVSSHRFKPHLRDITCETRDIFFFPHSMERVEISGHRLNIQENGTLNLNWPRNNGHCLLMSFASFRLQPSESATFPSSPWNTSVQWRLYRGAEWVNVRLFFTWTMNLYI